MKERNASGKAKRPSVGIGVLIMNKDGHILLSKRKKKYGFGKLALPGGHVEWMESLVETAKREVLEETGIQLDKVEELRDYTEEIRPEDGKHYVTFYLIAQMPEDQEPRQMEPAKHGPWGWYDPFKLPRHAWSPTKRLVKRSGDLIRKFFGDMLWKKFNEV
jgi:8-oxo-dGTP diphosphatase